MERWGSFLQLRCACYVARQRGELYSHYRIQSRISGVLYSEICHIQVRSSDGDSEVSGSVYLRKRRRFDHLGRYRLDRSVANCEQRTKN